MRSWTFAAMRAELPWSLERRAGSAFNSLECSRSRRLMSCWPFVAGTSGELELERIRREYSAALVSLLELDLADLESASASSRIFEETHTPLALLLISNAGVMAPPFSRTRQGFELQFGTNHREHFGLADRLMPQLARTAASRLVVVSSAGADFRPPI